jgi:pimeloyl-ACP methyl ester carboxylesterase
VVVPHAGHRVAEEAPEAVAREVLAAVRQALGRGAEVEAGERP